MTFSRKQLAGQQSHEKPWSLITGAAKRLGADFAWALHRHGYCVALHYHKSKDACFDLRQRIRQDNGIAEMISADLTQPDDVVALTDFLADKPWQNTIHNASLFMPDSASHFDSALLDQAMKVHVKSPQMISERMHHQNKDSHYSENDNTIVYLLDNKLRMPSPDFFSYTITKAALAVVMTMQCQAFAPSIRVNAVAPGLTLPSLWLKHARFDNRHRDTPLQKGPTSQDIVSAVLFLINNPAVTGECITVDCGKSRHY